MFTLFSPCFFVFTYVPLLTYFDTCLHMCTPVYSCLPMFTPFYLCMKLFSGVYLCYHCLLVHVYLCLPMFTVFTYVYHFKARSHCTRLRPEVPINQWCRLRNVKSWNQFNFYDASTVHIGLPVVTRCATSAVWIGLYSCFVYPCWLVFNYVYAWLPIFTHA